MAYNADPYRGDQYLFHGISNAGQAIGGGLAKLGEYFEKQKEEEKQRARQFKSLAEYADAAGIMPKDKATVLGLDELKGHVEGTIAKQKIEEEMQRQQLLKAQLAQYARQAQEDEAVGTALNNYSQPPETFGALGDYAPRAMAPPTEGERTRLALRTPGLGGRGAVSLLHYLSAMKPSAPMLGLGQTMEVPNLGTYVGNGTGRPQFVPKANTWGLEPGKTVTLPGNRTGIPVSPNSMVVKDPEKTAPNVPDWVFADDVEAFKKGIRSLKDPTQRQAALEQRNKYMSAIGRPMTADQMILMKALGIDLPAGNPNANNPAPAPYKGTPPPAEDPADPLNLFRK